MYSLPNEIFFNITNFLPNDDITDLMFLSNKFNVFVTARLKKIDQEMSTMNQCINSFMPIPEPDPSDNEWISQLNLKKFEPTGSVAKKRMKEIFEDEAFINWVLKGVCQSIYSFKEAMSLERFNLPTFFRVLCALISRPKFRQEYNISWDMAGYIQFICCCPLEIFGQTYRDLNQIWSFYND